MFDILVEGEVVAVAVQSLVKPFVETLIRMLPDVMSIQTKVHDDGRGTKNNSEATQATKK